MVTMAVEKHIVAIIPARAGSKGIPKKNVRCLAGKPLIAYTIEAALNSEVIDRVIVSTDSNEIADIAKSYGADVPFLRPPELSTDDASSFSVFRHAIEYLEKNESYPVDIGVLLQPTSPLRGAKRIDEVIEKILTSDCNSVITVCKTKHHHPYWSFKMQDDELIPLMENVIPINRRQLLPDVYAVNGAVYAIKRNVIFEQASFFGKNVRAIIMSEEESLDIDNYLDFFIAEMVLTCWKRWIDDKNENK